MAAQSLSNTRHHATSPALLLTGVLCTLHTTVATVVYHCSCRIEELEKAQAQLNGERQRLQEDLEEVQERLTAGQTVFNNDNLI